jgi:hypothetical protein
VPYHGVAGGSAGETADARLAVGTPGDALAGLTKPKAACQYVDGRLRRIRRKPEIQLVDQEGFMRFFRFSDVRR